jgi:excinuclease ABC subunit A
MDTLVSDFAKENPKFISQGKTHIQQIIAIDQSPIGRTPRSNPATYTKLFDHIRKLYSGQELAKQKGFGKSDFSFNVKGGRCEACQGAGYQQVGMHFIGNVEIRCEHCGGKRFKEELLEVKFQNKNIYEVLEMQVNKACDFFKEQKDIYRIVSALQKLGLGYLQLGQRATTLSGGEAQRVKLATEMSRKTKGKTLYILDEPTTGLHSYDVEILIQSLNELRELGHSIIVIEHHHHILQQADHIIELGPESGYQGGEVVFQGNYSDLLKENTLTAQALRGEFIQEKIDEIQNSFESNEIQIKGARTNNLKNIDVDIPKNKLTVITGVSGSGKSSLAFDTLFAEGRNQYLQSLPNYVRGRMNSNSQAQFDSIKGLTPVIAIDGKKSNSSPRSTLGTISEVYDLFRLLYSRIGFEAKGNNCELESSAFSFNNQDAACPECKGLGEITTTDPLKLISHPEKSILEGALTGSKTGKFYGDPNGQFVWTLKALDAALKLGLENPWQDLSEESKSLVLFGKPNLELDVEWKVTRKGKSGSHQFKTVWQGLVALIDEEYQRKHDDKRGESMLAIMKQVECPVCKGKRLNSQALEIRIGELNIAELSEKSIAQCISIIQNWKQELSSKQLQISYEIRKELLSRFQGLVNMELEYLQINRKASTLSGGEMQRLKIAGHIYGALSGITYVLDEPSIGLHPKNTQKLLHELERLRDLGNTVVLVEHDTDIIQAAEHLILMGPDAGANGGEVVDYGSAHNVMKKHQLIGKGFKKIALDNASSRAEIQIKSAYANNLKNIDLSISTAQLVGISGVSGSGKSSLLYEVIYRSAKAQKPINCEAINGLNKFDEVVLVNQGLEDGSSLSIPLSYLGIFYSYPRLIALRATTK